MGNILAGVTKKLSEDSEEDAPTEKGKNSKIKSYSFHTATKTPEKYLLL